ncbi:MAG: cytochrome c3 family protein [Candidatus Methylomirabilia bacterium]
MWTKAGVGIIGLTLLAILLFLAFSPGKFPRAGVAGPVQPIAFSHKIHAGQYKIDCQYCHADARRSEYAGIPSVMRCMGCHKITAADRPEIKKLAEYNAKQEPIPWVRIYKVPELAYFPHKPHIRAKVECKTCHGAVETMDRIGAKTGQNLPNDLLNLVGLARTATPLTMGWCLECHVAKEASVECTSCHH